MLPLVTACSDDEEESTQPEERFKVADNELTPATGTILYLNGKYNAHKICTYYCFSPRVCFKGILSATEGKTIFSDIFTYSLSNSTLTVTFTETKKQETFKLEKTKDRPLQNGDKIYLNEDQYTVDIKNQ